MHILVTQGRALRAVQAALPQALVQELLEKHQTQWGRLTLHLLPWLEQNAFDELLWGSDVNCVRGEDSLVRALWAGRPFVWQIYPQDDQAHHAKLQAFLDWMQAPPALRTWHAVWNGVASTPLPALTVGDWQDWQRCVQAARQRLLQQADMAEQLLRLAADHLPDTR